METHCAARGTNLPLSLILPTADFFPDSFNTGIESAEITLFRVKQLMDLSDWRCRLRPFGSADQDLNQDLKRGGILGESQWSATSVPASPESADVVTIAYDETLHQDPIALVSTFAHALSRYLVGGIESAPPEGWSETSFGELADLVAINEGFGIFLCNSAFEFNQWTANDSQGWSYSRRGFLNDSELAFSLAIFCIRHGLDAKDAIKFLKPNPREIFIDALGYVEELNEEIDYD